jgi:hypothetical protein
VLFVYLLRLHFPKINFRYRKRVFVKNDVKEEREVELSVTSDKFQLIPWQTVLTES